MWATELSEDRGAGRREKDAGLRVPFLPVKNEPGSFHSWAGWGGRFNVGSHALCSWALGTVSDAPTVKRHLMNG